MLKLLPVFLLVIGFTACSSDDDNGTTTPAPQNMLEVIQSDPELTTLAAALEITGLSGAIETTNPITILAPTNSAFATFLNGTNAEDVDVDVLAAILLNHVINADLKASDLIGLGSGYASSLSPNADGLNLSIYFNTTNGVRFNNTGAVTANGADIDGSNGTLHKIDAVLDLPSLLNHVENNSDFDTLNVALTATGLAGTVDTANLTILAPDNDAFTEFDPNLDDIPGVTQVLLNHVLGGTITSTNLVDAGDGYNTTLADYNDELKMSIYFNTTDGVVFNGISTVAQADVVGTNGVIHGVDTVIDLPTIATFATANPALSGLVAALTRADEGSNDINFLSLLSDPEPITGPLTVFGPADPAFDVLLADLGVDSLADVDPADVYNLILLHVALGNVRAADLPSLNGVIPTLGGNLDLAGTVITDGDGNTINILAPNLVDIQAINGVVHAVDYVIRSAVE